MMYNPQLETFLCVADAGSFNKAAATLYITPTAVVKQVNLLESSLGLTLFTRTHRGLVLTPTSSLSWSPTKTRRRTRGKFSQIWARTSTSWPGHLMPARCRTGGARRCC